MKDALIGKFGYTWEAASCLQEAIAMLAHNPRMVIGTLDPDGLELLRTARRYNRETEVVVLEKDVE